MGEVATAVGSGEVEMGMAGGAFRRLRERGGPYVDKTGHLRWLAERGTHYFLARPPGFGKSLLLDTCRELFRGRRRLFDGLAIHDEWDWSARHPVLGISLEPSTPMGPDALRKRLAGQIGSVAGESGIALRTRTLEGSFVSLAEELHERAERRVAILVDGYDQPILDAIAEPELARGNRGLLQSFYTTIKQCGAHVQFCMVAGVSGFTLTDGFGGGLNNLID